MIPAEERIRAAIGLKKPDRVPLAPMLDMFAIRYCGFSQYDLLFDVPKADEALEITLKAVGAIDALHQSYAGLGGLLSLALPNLPRIPGVDGVPLDTEWQFVEKSVMGPDEYAEIERLGAFKWLVEKCRPTHPYLNSRSAVARAVLSLIEDARAVKRSARRWEKRGVTTSSRSSRSRSGWRWSSSSRTTG